MIRAFIQARMTSNRFPGKVLAPLAGRPLIERVVEQVAQVVPRAQIVLATSSEPSDDPLVAYLERLDVAVCRGSLSNVFDRFRACLAAYPCHWFFRISADSPLLNTRVMASMLAYADSPSADLVTNVQKRTFPHGHSVELLKAATFAAIDPGRLSPEEQEHVTPFYYAHADEFEIINLENTNTAYADFNFAVDTIDDLCWTERFLEGGGQYPEPVIVESDRRV